MDKKVVATNRKAFHDFEILEKYEAGLVLAGYEVKSIRQGHVNLTDGFVYFNDGEAFLENVNISPYAQQSTHVSEYEPRRKRKILLHKNEILRLFARTREKGLSLVPLEIFFSPKGHAKVVLGLAKGKRTIDKRETLRRRETEREMQKELKGRRT